jgi:nitrate reductase beta subunit
MTPQAMEEMYRLLAVAKYEDRFVVPPAHRELAGELSAQQGACGLDFPGGPGACVDGHAAAADPGGAFHLNGHRNDALAELRERRARERAQRRAGR